MTDARNGPTFRQQLAADVAAAGGPAEPRPEDAAAAGKTLFDLPGSTDLTVTVVVPKERVKDVPSQALVRIASRADGRYYLGVVTAGPFAEPDGGLRGDSPMLTAVATHGGDYLPPYHGRVQVTILGEELTGGALTPPRLRPLPNSPVFVLSDDESRKVLRCEGDLRLGLAAGHQGVVVGVPSDKKAVLPRHTAILGTTGGGKSTTVAGLVKRAAEAGMAVVLLDVEGEYVHLHEPTDQAGMPKALADRGLAPAGLKDGSMSVYHLVGRDAANPDHPDLRAFSLQFARLSPHTVVEMIGANDAQQERYWFAYELCKALMRDLGVFPEGSASDADKEKQEKLIQRLDEFDRGWPRMTLSLLLDVVGVCKAAVAKTPFTPYGDVLKTPAGQQAIKARLDVKQMPGNVSSWGKVLSLLWRLHRLRVFDRHGKGVKFLNHPDLLRPGQVSVIDLSDAGMTELSNIAIADLLRGIQEAQEAAYRKFEKGGADKPPRVLIVIEEAHEFLSEDRIDRMPVLFQQVARIAKRGRKRWLGLCFVTQLPAHLPKQVLGLCNSFVLHKLTDPAVVGLLKRTVPGIDDGMWDRLPGLAQGQAIVSFPHFTRPLMVSIDPAPGKLRLVD
jgi:DNA helicase HerA-like ATPase